MACGISFKIHWSRIATLLLKQLGTRLALQTMEMVAVNIQGLVGGLRALLTVLVPHCSQQPQGVDDGLQDDQKMGVIPQLLLQNADRGHFKELNGFVGIFSDASFCHGIHTSTVPQRTEGGTLFLKTNNCVRPTVVYCHVKGS